MAMTKSIDHGAPLSEGESERRSDAGGREGLPDFMVIGAAKSGSTTLHQYLCRHPDVCMAEPKEPEFFSDDDVWHNGLEWYKGLFPCNDSSVVRGEASTTYTRWPHTADAAERIARTCPHVKLIYIMRHPVERAYSHYAHVMRSGLRMTFEEALSNDDIYIDCSRYMMQIQRYLRFFPSDRMLLLLLSDLKTSPATTMGRVQEFLGLSPRDLSQGGAIHANRSNDHLVDRRLTNAFASVSHTPVLKSIVRMTPHNWRHAAYNMVRNVGVIRAALGRRRLQPMLPETRQELLAQFRSEVDELAEYMATDLSEWQK